MVSRLARRPPAVHEPQRLPRPRQRPLRCGSWSPRTRRPTRPASSTPTARRCPIPTGRRTRPLPRAVEPGENVLRRRAALDRLHEQRSDADRRATGPSRESGSCRRHARSTCGSGARRQSSCSRRRCARPGRHRSRRAIALPSGRQMRRPRACREAGDALRLAAVRDIDHVNLRGFVACRGGSRRRCGCRRDSMRRRSRRRASRSDAGAARCRRSARSTDRWTCSRSSYAGSVTCTAAQRPSGLTTGAPRRSREPDVLVRDRALLCGRRRRQQHARGCRARSRGARISRWCLRVDDPAPVEEPGRRRLKAGLFELISWRNNPVSRESCPGVS